MTVLYPNGIVIDACNMKQMRANFLILSFIVFLIFNTKSYSQEGLPIYSDYLTDNYYLLFPSMAGAANCTKVRFTGRKQWMDQDEAPNLQTVSINGNLHLEPLHLKIKMDITHNLEHILLMHIILCFLEVSWI